MTARGEDHAAFVKAAVEEFDRTENPLADALASERARSQRLQEENTRLRKALVGLLDAGVYPDRRAIRNAREALKDSSDA